MIWPGLSCATLNSNLNLFVKMVQLKLKEIGAGLLQFKFNFMLSCTFITLHRILGSGALTGRKVACKDY